MDAQEVNKLRALCEQTLLILDSIQQLTSPQVSGKIQTGKDELNVFLLELDKPELNLSRMQVIADRITAIGQDLINYGMLILPKNENN
jgi:hypothetical protein